MKIKKRVLKNIGVAFLVFMVAVIGLLWGYTTMNENNNETNEGKNPIAILETNMGNIKIELFKDKSPITVDNFVKLSEDGFYENVIFHRVIDNFMIQGGDPDGTGMGGPGYTIKDEFSDLTFNKKGLLAMANAGPDTGGSQFFITVALTPWLNNKHTIFGEVIEGYDIVEKISKVEVGMNDKPNEDVVIQKVIIEK